MKEISVFKIIKGISLHFKLNLILPFCSCDYETKKENEVGMKHMFFGILNLVFQVVYTNFSKHVRVSLI